MAKDVEQLINDTIVLLKSTLQTAQPQQADEVTKIIRECLHPAFSEVSEADHKKLYQKLSLKLHQDKLEQQQKEIYGFLHPIDAHHIPQQVLNEYQEYQKYKQANFFQNTASDPVQGTKNFLFYLLTKFAPMYFAYERYSQPWQSIVHIINWTVTIGLLVGYLSLTLSLTAIYGTIIWLALKLENFVVNAITNSKLDEKTAELENAPERKEQEKRHTIDMLKLEEQFMVIYLHNNPDMSWRIEKMTNEEFLEYLAVQKYINGYAEHFPNDNATFAEQEKFLNECRAAAETKIGDGQKKANGFSKIALIAQSLFHSIAKPLSDNTGYAALEAILIKPLLVLLTPLILVASICIELANYLNTILGLALLAAVAAIKITSMAIYNIPLYINDAIRYMKGSCKDTDVQDDADLKKEPSAGDDIRSSTQGMYGSKKDSKPEPVEQGSYEKLFKERPSAGSKPQETFPQLSM